MLRAITHSVYRGHELDPTCPGCLEVLGFATVRGYEGDRARPTCWAREASDPSAPAREPDCDSEPARDSAAERASDSDSDSAGERG
jgi:hypothetical protein